MQPGGRLLGQQVGEPAETDSIAAASSAVDGAAVAGELEVGQHPPGRVELRPGRRGRLGSGSRPMKPSCSAPNAVAPAAWVPPAPGRRRRPRRRWAGPARPSAGSGTRGRRRAPRGPATPPGASASQRSPPPRPRRSPRGRAGGSSSARWCRRRAGAGWRWRCRRRRRAPWPPPPCRAAPRRAARPAAGGSSAGPVGPSGRRAAGGDDQRAACALDHRQHLLEAVVPTVVRVRHVAARFDGSKSRNSRTRSASAPGGERGCRRGCRASMASTRSRSASQPAVELLGAVPAGVVPGRRSGSPPPAGPSARPGASRRCRSWPPRPGRRGRPRGDPRGEHHLGHGGAADVAQADHGDPVAAPGVAGGAAVLAGSVIVDPDERRRRPR